MKFALTFISLVLFSINGNSQNKNYSLINDFNQLVGKWKGSLTYLDYTSGNPFTMDADLIVTFDKGKQIFLFSNIYPKEKSENSIDTIVIKKDQVGSEKIKSRLKSKSGEVVIITEEKGFDGNDNLPALFKHTYIISKSNFIIRKEVLFDGKQNWIKRLEYNYKKAWQVR